MSNQLKILNEIVDQCSKEHLHSVFAPLVDLPKTSTKAEMISYCLNKELGAYGIKTYPSPDKTMILIDDETMSKVLDFFNGKSYKPYFTEEQIHRLRTIQKVSNDNKVNIYWAQSGFRRKYYYIKQYGFNGANLYNVLNLNTANVAAATLSPTGAAALTMAGIVGLSWSGGLFFSMLENYIPNTMPTLKASVSGLKVVVSFPIRTVEWTSNQIFGAVEKRVIGIPLPTNITEVYGLNLGPRLQDLSKLKTGVMEWLIERLKKAL